MPASDKRIIEVLAFELANGTEKTIEVKGVSASSLTRYRALARAHKLDIPEESLESKEISGQATDLDDFLKRNNIDLDVWEVAHWEIVEGDWDVSSKERDQDLTWTIEKDSKGNKNVTVYNLANAKESPKSLRNCSKSVKLKIRHRNNLQNRQI